MTILFWSRISAVATILCIDDHGPTLQTLCLIFRKNGYECLGAQNATEARKLFCKNEVDLVVLDRSLESCDGIALAAEFKSIRPVPILMLSGWTDVEKPEGVDVFMNKPQEPRILLAAALSLIVRAQSATA